MRGLVCVALAAWPLGALAQDVGPEKIDIHGSLVQGFLYSNHNNYLTTKSSAGSSEWTEGVINFGTSVSEKMRVGMQIHTLRLGDLGKQQLEIDWAYGDYRTNDYFGIRAGKIKTPIGLYNDTQDIDAIHLWSLMPQSMYPVDSRALVLAHVGGVAYGKAPVPSALGAFTYQAFAGSRSLNETDGYYLRAKDGGTELDADAGGTIVGGDLRWRAPLKGLTLGSSVLFQNFESTVKFQGAPAGLRFNLENDPLIRYYGEYENGGLVLAAEYKRFAFTPIYNAPLARSTTDERGWYASGSYRLTSRLWLGTYHSRAYPNYRRRETSYLKDWAVSGRFDINNYFYAKVEGHFLKGTAGGFFASTNPGGIKPETKLVVARLGFTF